MADYPDNDPAAEDGAAKKRPINEISHLFLSSVRELHAMPGVPRPQRVPPGKPRPAAPQPPPPLLAQDANDVDVPPAEPVGEGERMPRTDDSIDLTPEQFAEVFGFNPVAKAPAPRRAPEPAPPSSSYSSSSSSSKVSSSSPVPPVSVVLTSHLAGQQAARVGQYARHLASRVGRVGVVEVDATGLRLSCFERGRQPAEPSDPASVECVDVRQVDEAIGEMSCDVQRWLVVLPGGPRTTQALALLRAAGHWVLLATCDHDGVVSGYRTIKGLAEALRAAPARPRLSVATLDAIDEAESLGVHRKLAGVCDQFLGWPLELEPPVAPATGAVTEHLLLSFRPPRVNGRLSDLNAEAPAPQWPIVARLLERARSAAPVLPATAVEAELADDDAAADDDEAALELELAEREEEAPMPATNNAAAARFRPTASPFADVPLAPEPPAAMKVPVSAAPAAGHAAARFVADVVVPTAPAVAAAAAPTTPKPAVAAAPTPEYLPMQTRTQAAPAADAAEVLDLPSADASPDVILDTVLRGDAGLVECPVRAPMCPAARLAITRDRGVTLMAVARQGLSDLRSIGQAYAWLRQNLTLIGMAMPQFALDGQRPPRLRLLVDQSDASAGVLEPMLASGNVTVTAYRKLRWGGRTGLLLEAA